MQRDTMTQPWWRGRRVQLSMRGLMVVVLVLGVVLGWVVRRAQIQRDVVAAIEQGGGIVYYNWETPGFHTQPDGRILGGTPRKKKGALGGPKWLVDRLGPDYLGHVTQVRVGPKDPDVVMARVARLEGLKALNFLLAVPVSDAGFKHVREMKDLVVISTPIRGTQLTGASLESLKDSTRLRTIYFTNYPPLSDANLAYLKRLTALQTIQVPATPRNVITDAGLVNLREMIDMRELTLPGSNLTSTGLANLRGMTRLSELRIHSTPASPIDSLAPIRHLTALTILSIANSSITDAGLGPVAGLAALQQLSLAETPITDAGLKHLRGLSRLADLDLHKTRVTDAGLSELAGLKSLRTLTLADTGVTDRGLAHLAGMSSLATLSLYGTAVTGEGLAHLAKLSSLITLNLGKTRVNDAALKHLTVLASLNKLNLMDTRVTGEGLKQIAGMKSLKQLIIKGAAATDAELDAIETTLPQLRIAQPPAFGQHR
jgi:internalin A